MVHTACTLWITGLIVGLIGQYLLSPWSDLTAARARVLASNTSGLTRQQIDTAVTLSVVGALTFAIVLAVVDGWVLTKLRAGRRWARPTLTGLGVLGGLTDLRQGPPGRGAQRHIPAGHRRRRHHHVPPRRYPLLHRPRTNDSPVGSALGHWQAAAQITTNDQVSAAGRKAGSTDTATKAPATRAHKQTALAFLTWCVAVRNCAAGSSCAPHRTWSTTRATTSRCSRGSSPR